MKTFFTADEITEADKLLLETKALLLCWWSLTEQDRLNKESLTGLTFLSFGIEERLDKLRENLNNAYYGQRDK